MTRCAVGCVCVLRFRGGCMVLSWPVAWQRRTAARSPTATPLGWPSTACAAAATLAPRQRLTLPPTTRARRAAGRTGQNSPPPHALNRASTAPRGLVFGMPAGTFCSTRNPVVCLPPSLTRHELSRLFWFPARSPPLRQVRVQLLGLPSGFHRRRRGLVALVRRLRIGRPAAVSRPGHLRGLPSRRGGQRNRRRNLRALPPSALLGGPMGRFLCFCHNPAHQWRAAFACVHFEGAPVHTCVCTNALACTPRGGPPSLSLSPSLRRARRPRPQGRPSARRAAWAPTPGKQAPPRACPAPTAQWRPSPAPAAATPAPPERCLCLPLAACL
jgi:hypothetical protein